MTELKIKDINGVWHTADLDNETKFAMNYQVNDIASIDRREGNISLTVKLPKTRENSIIFGFSHLEDSFSEVPYRNLDCALISNSIYLTEKGCVIKILKITDFYECQILSSIINFYQLIKNTAMSDIDLGQASYSRDSLLNQQLTYNNILFLLADFESINHFIFSENAPLRLFRTLPFIKLLYAVNTVLQQLGYQSVNNLNINEIQHLLRIGNYDSGSTDISQFFPKLSDILTTTDPQTTQFFLNFSSTNLWKNLLLLSSSVLIDTELGEFSQTDTGNAIYYFPIDKIQFHAYITLSLPAITNPDWTVIVELWDRENHVWQSQEQAAVTSVRAYVTFDGKVHSVITDDVDIFQSDTPVAIRIRVFAQNLPANTPVGTQVVISSPVRTKENDTTVLAGEDIPVSRNLGFNFVSELISFFVKLYGLIIYVEEETKTVYFKTIQAVYDNIPNAVDWTEKIDRSGWESVFEMNSYAQRNILKLKPASKSGYVEQTYFDIDNKILETEKTLFELETKSTPKIESVVMIEDAVVGYDSQMDNKIGSIEFDAKTPCCVEINTDDQILRDFSWAFESATNFNTAYAGKLNLDSIKNNYYDKLISGLLVKARILTAKFNLTDEDIYRWNNATGIVTPVFLRQTGQFYYINKIINYQSGISTKVELVRL